MPSLRSGITSGLGLCIRPYRYASQLVRRYYITGVNGNRISPAILDLGQKQNMFRTTEFSVTSASIPILMEKENKYLRNLNTSTEKFKSLLRDNFLS